MMHPRLLAQMFHVRIHREGWFFIRWGGLITLILMLSPIRYLWVLGLLGTMGVALFFRNPDRVSPSMPSALISPADGVVVEIRTDQVPPEEVGLSEGSWVKVGIFLSPFDVHVNRIPCTGKVTQRSYRPGAFAHAVTRQTQPDNERLSLILTTPENETVVCTQVAGFLARRIICRAEVGHDVQAGQEYGIICFGSRIDLYLPADTAVWVSRDQRVRAGETVLGFLPSGREARIGDLAAPLEVDGSTPVPSSLPSQE